MFKLYVGIIVKNLLMAIIEEEKLMIGSIFSGPCSQKNFCPVKDIMATFGDKWSMYTVLLLGQNDKMRFNDLKCHIEGISQRMLTVTLRSLEENGIVSRKLFPEVPPRVEYQLTALGEGLLSQLLSLAKWANDNFTEVVASRKYYESKHCKETA